MKKVLLGVLYLVLTIISLNHLQAQVAAGTWEFGPTTASGTTAGVSPPNSAIVANNASFSGVGSVGFVSGNPGAAYTGNGWNTTTTIDLTEYLEISITNNKPTAIPISFFSFDHLRSNNGPTSLIVRYSGNNYSTNIISEATGAGGTWTTSSTPDVNYTLLSGGTVRFRVYGLNATSSTGTWRFDNVSIESTIPLPVHLISFQAENKERKSILNWSTATEENNSHFLVQRSRDGIRYTNIGKVDGRGTADFQNNYTFTDERPMSGLNYYRLQQVDYDGTSEYSPVVTATLRGLGAAVAPTVEVQEAVTVTLEQSLATEGRVRILDASGRMVSVLALAPGQDQYQIPTGHLPTGVYFLNIEADGETTQQRMVK